MLQYLRARPHGKGVWRWWSRRRRRIQPRWWWWKLQSPQCESSQRKSAHQQAQHQSPHDPPIGASKHAVEVALNRITPLDFETFDAIDLTSLDTAIGSHDETEPSFEQALFTDDETFFANDQALSSDDQALSSVTAFSSDNATFGASDSFPSRHSSR